MTDDLAAAEAHLRRLTHHWNSDANDDLRAIGRVLTEYDRRAEEIATLRPTEPPARYSTPFANGTEVDWFRANRCDQCVHDHPEGGGCDEFALGVVVEGGWATDGRLIPVERSAANPLGVECQRFERTTFPDLVRRTTAAAMADFPPDYQPTAHVVITTPTEEDPRG